MELKKLNKYHYNGFNKNCSGIVVITQLPNRNNRVEICRIELPLKNPFWVNKYDLEEIMTDEERIIRKYENKLNSVNTSEMTKDLKRYSDEDIRKIYQIILKDLNNLFG